MRVPLPVLVSLVLLIGSAAGAAAPSDVGTITRLSQEFSDASARGDGKALAGYLDEDVVFVDESGEVGGKEDIVSGAKPPANGTSNHLEQTDLVVKLHGDVAVTSFTDNATANVYGQTTHARFRSTEVWRKKGGAWKMISSQTLALPDDPPAIQLPAAALDQYVGTYVAAPELVIKVARAGDGLTGAVNGGKAAPMLAECADVFFSAGSPRVRRIFTRDADGKIIGFNARHEGHDLHFKREV